MIQVWIGYHMNRLAYVAIATGDHQDVHFQARSHVGAIVLGGLEKSRHRQRWLFETGGEMDTSRIADRIITGAIDRFDPVSGGNDTALVQGNMAGLFGPCVTSFKSDHVALSLGVLSAVAATVAAAAVHPSRRDWDLPHRPRSFVFAASRICAALIRLDLHNRGLGARMFCSNLRRSRLVEQLQAVPETEMVVLESRTDSGGVVGLGGGGVRQALEAARNAERSREPSAVASTSSDVAAFVETTCGFRPFWLF